MADTAKDLLISIRDQINNFLANDAPDPPPDDLPPVTAPDVSFTFQNHKLKISGTSQGPQILLTIYPKEDN